MNNAKEKEASNMRLMLETPIGKLLAKMSVPMMVALMVNGLYYLVDAAFVGNVVGPNGVAALAVGFPIDMFAISLALMLAIGTAAVLSLKLGRGDYREVGKTLKSAVLFTAGISILLSAVLLIFKDTILLALGAAEEIYPHANSYYRVIIPGYIFVLLSFLATNSIRAEGNVKLASVGMITGAFLNIVLDALFIAGLGWGTAGAAWGTIIARGVTIAIYLFYYYGGGSVVDIKTGAWSIDFSEIKMILKIGFSAFLNQVGFSFLAAVVNVSIKKYGTPLDLSVFGIIGRILIFITMPLTGIGQGVQTVAGYNFGAGDYRRVRQTVNMGYLFSLLFGGFLFVVLFFFPREVFTLFTKSGSLIDAGIEPLRITTLLVPLIGIQIVTYFYYIALHKALSSIIVSICRTVLFITPFIFFLSYLYGMTGIWVSFPISDFIAALFCLYIANYVGEHALNGRRYVPRPV